MDSNSYPDLGEQHLGTLFEDFLGDSDRSRENSKTGASVGGSPDTNEVRPPDSSRPVITATQSEPLLGTATPSKGPARKPRSRRALPRSASQSAAGTSNLSSPSTEPSTPSSIPNKRARLDIDAETPPLTRSRQRQISRSSPDPQGSRSRSDSVQSDPVLEDEDASILDSTPSSIRDSPSHSEQPCKASEIDGKIRTLLQESTTSKTKDQELGYVYVGLAEGPVELIKIGCSKKEPSIREKSIVAACGVKFLRFDSTPVRFKDYKRVERLVHFELAHLKHESPCDKQRCRAKQHREWFKVDLATAFSVVKRWWRFSAQDPWTSDGKLKPFWQDRLNNIEVAPGTEDANDHTARVQRWEGFATLSISERVECFLKTHYPWSTAKAEKFWRYWCFMAFVFFLYHATWLWLDVSLLAMVLTVCIR